MFLQQPVKDRKTFARFVLLVSKLLKYSCYSSSKPKNRKDKDVPQLRHLTDMVDKVCPTLVGYELSSNEVGRVLRAS